MNDDFQIRPCQAGTDQQLLLQSGLPLRYVRQYTNRSPVYFLLNALGVCRNRLYVMTPRNDENIVGTILLRRIQGILLRPTWKIHAVGVATELRGRGLGKALMDFALTKLVDLGAKSASLKVADNNKPAICLYRKCGFAETARQGDQIIFRRQFDSPVDGAHVTIKGQWVKVPTLKLNNKTLVRTGRWVRRAELHDEEWSPPSQRQNMEILVTELKKSVSFADYFTFTQAVDDPIPQYPYYWEWDNAATICTDNYEDWWENHLPQVTRKNVRRAQRRGVVVRQMILDDSTVDQIHQLYGQIQVKQGTRFAHCDKERATVKRELATFAERSEFLGAFHDQRLIGFIKLVYAGDVAGIMHLVTRNEDYDKRPANALLAQAVQLCTEKRLSHLVYGKYNYGNKTKSSLTEYKRRNGFSKSEFPRYYVPLTWRGKIFVGLRLHRGLLGLLPGSIIHALLALRAWLRQGRNLGAELNEQMHD